MLNSVTHQIRLSKRSTGERTSSSGRRRGAVSDARTRRAIPASAIASLLMMSVLFTVVVFSPPARAAATVTTDKPDYSPEEVVTITGSGFAANGTVTVSVTRPYDQVDTWDVNADGEGEFTTTYQLDGITGLYAVKATDGGNTA